MTIAEEVDKFIELIRDDLAAQLDEALATLPPAERAATKRVRGLLLGQLIEATRVRNLRHRLDELEAAMRPPEEALH
jgi:hypothetical protein